MYIGNQADFPTLEIYCVFSFLLLQSYQNLSFFCIFPEENVEIAGEIIMWSYKIV